MDNKKELDENIQDAVIVGSENEKPNQLVILLENSKLEKTKSQELLENFSSYFEMAAEWERKEQAMEVTEDSSPDEIEKATMAVKFLKEKRIAIEKKRKELKDSYLQGGRTIDSIAGVLNALVEPLEKKFLEKAKVKELAAAERARKLKQEREVLILPYYDYVPKFGDFGTMLEGDFQSLLSGAILKKEKAEADAEAARLAEIERIEKEKQAEIDRKAEADRLAKEQAEAVRKAEEAMRVAREQAEIAKAEAAAARIKAEEEQKRLDAERELLRKTVFVPKTQDEINFEAESESLKTKQQEEAKAEAEKMRIEAEKNRIESEIAKADAEKAKADAEQSRIDAEKAKADAEQSRIEAEKAKAEAEKMRIEAENAKAEAEKSIAESGILISEKCSPAPDFFKQTDFCKKYFTHSEPELDEFELAQIHHCGTIEEPEQPKTDKQKMESMLEFFKEIKLPEFESDEAKKAVLSVKELLRKTVSFIETTTKKM